MAITRSTTRLPGVIICQVRITRSTLATTRVATGLLRRRDSSGPGRELTGAITVARHATPLEVSRCRRTGTAESAIDLAGLPVAQPAGEARLSRVRRRPPLRRPGSPRSVGRGLWERHPVTVPSGILLQAEQGVEHGPRLAHDRLDPVRGPGPPGAVDQQRLFLVDPDQDARKDAVHQDIQDDAPRCDESATLARFVSRSCRRQHGEIPRRESIGSRRNRGHVRLSFAGLSDDGA